MNRKKYATNCRRTSSIMAHNYGAMGNGSPFESDALSGSTVSSSPLPQYSYVHVRVSVYVPLCLYTSMSMVERAVFAHRYNVRLSERKKKNRGEEPLMLGSTIRRRTFPSMYADRSGLRNIKATRCKRCDGVRSVHFAFLP